MYEAAMLVP